MLEKGLRERIEGGENIIESTSCFVSYGLKGQQGKQWNEWMQIILATQQEFPLKWQNNALEKRKTYYRRSQTGINLGYLSI